MDLVLLTTLLHENLSTEVVKKLLDNQSEKVINFLNGHRIVVVGCPFERLWVQVFYGTRNPKCYYVTATQVRTGLVHLRDNGAEGASAAD